MTLPHQRTEAVLQARRFLAWLASNGKEPYCMVPPSGGVPKKIRGEAHHILRHFPMGVDLLDADAFDPVIVRRHYGAPDQKVPEQGRLFTEGKP